MEGDSEADRIREFKTSLEELTQNSKPHINMLTMLAEAEARSETAAAGIVKVIEERLHAVRSDRKGLSPFEMPTLFLIDSICKNVKGVYIKLFTQNIVSNFCRIFERGNEATRAHLFRLRGTWSDVFSPEKMLALDRRIKEIDPAWPITAAPVAGAPTETKAVHINPKFISKGPRVGGDIPEPDLRQQELQRIMEEKKLLEQQVEAQKRENLQLKNTLRTSPNDPFGATLNTGVAQPAAARGGKRKGRQAGGGKRVKVARASGANAMPLAQRRNPSSLEFCRSPPDIGAQQPGPLYSRRPPNDVGPYPVNGNMASSQQIPQQLWPTGDVDPRIFENAGLGPRTDIDYRSYSTDSAGFPLQGCPSVTSAFDPMNQYNRPIPITTSIMFPSPTRSLNAGHNVPLSGMSSIPTSAATSSGPSVGSSDNRVKAILDILNFGSVNKRSDVGSNISDPSIASGQVIPGQMHALSVSGVTASSSPTSATSHFSTLTHLKQNETLTRSPNQDFGLFETASTSDIRKKQLEPQLDWASSDSLKIGRPSLVAALYAGRQCTSCPLRFSPDQESSYKKHLDWHFRQNQKKKVKSTRAMRPWYYKLELWLLFNEISEEDKSSSIFEAGLKEGDDSSCPLPDSESCVVKSRSEDSLNVCVVCQEKFEVFQHEDDDDFYLKGAVEHNSQLFHPSCLSDMSRVLSTSQVEGTNDEEPVKEGEENKDIDEKSSPMDVQSSVSDEVAIIQPKSKDVAEKDELNESIQCTIKEEQEEMSYEDQPVTASTEPIKQEEETEKLCGEEPFEERVTENIFSSETLNNELQPSPSSMKDQVRDEEETTPGEDEKGVSSVEVDENGDDDQSSSDVKKSPLPDPSDDELLTPQPVVTSTPPKITLQINLKSAPPIQPVPSLTNGTEASSQSPAKSPSPPPPSSPPSTIKSPQRSPREPGVNTVTRGREESALCSIM